MRSCPARDGQAISARATAAWSVATAGGYGGLVSRLPRPETRIRGDAARRHGTELKIGCADRRRCVPGANIGPGHKATEAFLFRGVSPGVGLSKSRISTSPSFPRSGVERSPGALLQNAGVDRDALLGDQAAVVGGEE